MTGELLLQRRPVRQVTTSDDGEGLGFDEDRTVATRDQKVGQLAIAPTFHDLRRADDPVVTKGVGQPDAEPLLLRALVLFENLTWLKLMRTVAPVDARERVA